jgi:hypothetical protein
MVSWEEKNGIIFWQNDFSPRVGLSMAFCKAEQCLLLLFLEKGTLSGQLTSHRRLDLLRSRTVLFASFSRKRRIQPIDYTGSRSLD